MRQETSWKLIYLVEGLAEVKYTGFSYIFHYPSCRLYQLLVQSVASHEHWWLELNKFPSSAYDTNLAGPDVLLMWSSGHVAHGFRPGPAASLGLCFQLLQALRWSSQVSVVLLILSFEDVTRFFFILEGPLVETGSGISTINAFKTGLASIMYNCIAIIYSYIHT